MDEAGSVEVEQWRRFVELLVLLVRSGRLDAVDGAALADAMGRPLDVARGRHELFAIARRHEELIQARDRCEPVPSG